MADKIIPSQEIRLPIQDLGELRRKYPLYMRGDHKARSITIISLVVGLAVIVYALIRFDFSFSRLGKGIEQLGIFLSLMVPPSPGTQFYLYLNGMAETLAIAFLGTMLAAIIAFPLGFLAARNVLPNFIARFFVRRSMDTIRSVDTLIWALVWINVVGLGPFAGILAIACSDIGTFGKLFSEAIENVDKRPEEGVTASGASIFERIRYGLMPESIPVIASQILYYFESNTRSATIVGIVGAGGIGQYLTENIRTLEWDKVAFIVIMVLITVAVIDFISSRLRFAIIGTRQIPF